MSILGSKVSRRRFILLVATTSLAYLLPGFRTGYSGVELSRLSIGLGARLLFLPDIHIHRAGSREYVVELVEEVEPDIVVIGGDLWDSATASIDVPLELLKNIKRKVKHLVMILGNHEHWSHQDRVIDLGDALVEIENQGVVVVRDDKVQLGTLLVAGLDWRENPQHYSSSLRLIGEVDLVVSHSPDAFPHLTSRQRILLAGHTHGGQICLPGKTSIVTNSYYGYKWGLYRENSRVMYVARGLGEKTPPRIYCSREALLVE